MSRASKSFTDGFFGSFRIALTVCVVACAMVSAFFQAGTSAAINVVRQSNHR